MMYPTNALLNVRMCSVYRGVDSVWTFFVMGLVVEPEEGADE